MKYSPKNFFMQDFTENLWIRIDDLTTYALIADRLFMMVILLGSAIVT